MSDTKIVQGSTSPGIRQIALDLTCALIAAGYVITTSDPEAAAEDAVQLLNRLEERLGVPATRDRLRG